MSIIKFENFSFKYAKSRDYTLRNINLDINEGEKILIVGKSGCGKSTLTKCINKLNKGTIEGKLTIAEKTVGTILQDSDAQFVAQTVGEDIAFILENNCIEIKEMKKRVYEISKLVDIQDFLSHKPQDLSGGQKQRVSLAGILIADSNILLFDEPLANLDPKTGEEAMKLIDNIHKKTNSTVIIVEHRLEDVLHINLDKIVVMDEGQVLAVDTVDNILSSGILNKIGIREPLDYIAKKYMQFNDNYSENKNKIVNWLNGNTEKAVKEKRNIISFENVDFAYTDKKVLKNISFDIKEGEMLSIVGKNGAGKSTLSKILCGFENDYTGKIHLNEVDISKFSIKERGDYIGYVMQNPNHMISQNTVKEEVEFSLKLKGLSTSVIDDIVNRVLKLCDIYEYRNWPISMISYGQKKRTTIASILVLDPKILILDEPTAAQDYTHYLEIMEFIKQINEKLNITIIMITHDMHLMLEYTDRSIVLADGEKIFDGSSIEVLTKKDILEKANLKITSLYNLAKEYGVDEYKFVKKFIDYERELRNENIRL